MTIVKKAPKKVTNAIDISVVGQKTIDAGTHANGGIGLKISKGGKKMSLKYLKNVFKKTKKKIYIYIYIYICLKNV